MKSDFRLASAYSAILESGEFDASWYLGKYEQAAEAVLGGRCADPLEHYLLEGHRQYYRPNFLFNEKAFYHYHHQELKAAKGRFLSGFHLAVTRPELMQDFLADRFCFQWYRQRHSNELRRDGQTPVAHYLTHRRRRDVMPSPLFSDAWYLSEHADALAAVHLGLVSCGYEHFLTTGIAEQRSPSPLFVEPWYREAYPDVTAQIDGHLLPGGYCHFLKHGDREQRRPAPFFDPPWYSQTNPDLSGPLSRRETTCLRHYVTCGFVEGRMPSLAAKEALEVKSPREIGLFDPIDCTRLKELLESIPLKDRAADFVQRCVRYLRRSNDQLEARAEAYGRQLEELLRVATFIRANLT